MHAGDSVGFRKALRIGLSRHLASLIFSLGVISRQPLNSALAIAVIGFALALPTGLYLLLHNAQLQVGSMREPPQISLYLLPSLNRQAAENLAERIVQQNPGLELNRIISPAQALEEFRAQAGFAQSLGALAGDNPLPAVIVLRPQFRQPARLQALVAHLKQQPKVEFVQADMQWLRRLGSILDLTGRGLWLMAVLLALGVILVVANILRLSIAAHRDEIEISSLFGASDAFVRRPFLYHGALYGFFGAALAILMLLACKWLLATPLARLNQLFDSNFSLLGIGFQEISMVLATGTVLGLGGAWLAVSQHLHTFKPR